MGDFEGMLTKREAASAIGVSLRTLDNWIKDKQLPYVKLSKTVRFLKADIRQYISDRRVA